jgi:ATP-dependent RNA helicase RhlE
MLDMGFLPDLKRIIRHLPEQRQSLFFSATMPPKIIELAERLVRNPVINVTPESISVEKIKQRVLFVERSGKQALLRQLLNDADVERALVFTRTKRGANVVAERLVRSGIKATAIHGNKSQGARQRALEEFRVKQVQVLVATDVAARGLDVDGITHVVNFDLPIEPEGYVHRIGRTGRAGAEGVALSFCCADERRGLLAIEKLIGQSVPIADEQPQPEPQEQRPAPQPRVRRDTAVQRPVSKRRRSKLAATRSPADRSVEQDKPKQGRRRKGRHLRQGVTRLR